MVALEFIEKFETNDIPSDLIAMYIVSLALFLTHTFILCEFQSTNNNNNDDVYNS